MDEVTRRRLKGEFGKAARDYAAARPGYPDVAVDWLVGDARDVLDLGAGSGPLTARLADRGLGVVAAEPSRNLLAELRATEPTVPVVCAGAEALPFSDATFDVVTVATAFHWFDARRALPALARVLRPGGRLSLVWNTRRPGAAWTGELDRLLRSAQPTTLHGDWGVDSARSLDDSAHFTPPERAEFDHEQRLDRRALVSLVASRSYVIALDEATRADLLGQVGALFDSAAGTSGRLALPYRAECFRSVVRR